MLSALLRNDSTESWLNKPKIHQDMRGLKKLRLIFLAGLCFEEYLSNNRILHGWHFELGLQGKIGSNGSHPFLLPGDQVNSMVDASIKSKRKVNHRTIAID